MADWNWNLCAIKHPKHNDSDNCGVYVSWFERNLIKYIEAILNHYPSNTLACLIIFMAKQIH